MRFRWYSIGTQFYNKRNVTKFDEFQFFTGLSQVPGNCFSHCMGLVRISMPSNLTTVAGLSFHNCTSLTTLTMLPVTPPVLQSNTFMGCSALTTIYVPSASVNAYKNADLWSNFATKIQAIP